MGAEHGNAGRHAFDRPAAENRPIATPKARAGLVDEAIAVGIAHGVALRTGLADDKYLYVGTTRAATYLGISCDKALPAALDKLRPMFAAHW